jgi:hypothetical protein
MQQIPGLSNQASAEIAPEPPRLKLGAVSELVRQDRQVSLAVVWQKDSVAQGHRAIAAQLEHRGSEETRPAGGAPPVEPDSLMIQQREQAS